MRRTSTFVIWAVAACLVLTAAVVYPQTIPHTVHHAHHNAATHSSVLCAWLCAAGQGIETVHTLIFSAGLVSTSRCAAPPSPIEQRLAFHASGRAPPGFSG